MKIGCVVMAAGASARFGRENKLLAPFGGKPLYRCAFAAAAREAFYAVSVVSHYEEILSAAEAEGFIPVYNPAPEDGISLTVSLGLRSLPDADALMFLVADQPLLSQTTVSELISFFLEDPASIAAPACGGKRGNPVIFPKAFFPELLALRGDRGGSGVIKAHPDALRLYPLADKRELFDVDTVEALYDLAKSTENGGTHHEIRTHL